MTVTTISSREFKHDTSKAKHASALGPVIITDQGKPAHVLLTIEEYERLIGKAGNIAELLAMPETSDIDFDPEKAQQLFRPAEFE